MVSSHQSDPIAIFEQLNLKLASIIQKQQETRAEHRSSQPKFLTEHLIKTYVLLHDVSNGNMKEAESIYGVSCSLVNLSLRAPVAFIEVIISARAHKIQVPLYLPQNDVQ